MISKTKESRVKQMTMKTKNLFHKSDYNSDFIVLVVDKV